MMSLTPSAEEDLMARIKVLSERVWERRCRLPDVEQWLANFDGSALGDVPAERLHALHLLAHVSYFGLPELRVLLRSMYRDLFRYPILQQLRSDHGGTTDSALIRAEFDEERDATRFLGMGNPAESGTHLLYYFRQENGLSKELFVQQQGLLSGPATDLATRIIPPSLKRVVFIDDLCGSGSQAVSYSRTLLKDLQQVASRDGRAIEFQYFVMFGTEEGLNAAKTETLFGRVDAVSRIDDTYKTFGPSSRVFRKPPVGVELSVSERLAKTYGAKLWPDWPLGFGDRQLLLAFHHNVPDNTLPIIWHDDSPTWHAALPRYHKVY